MQSSICSLRAVPSACRAEAVFSTTGRHCVAKSHHKYAHAAGHRTIGTHQGAYTAPQLRGGPARRSAGVCGAGAMDSMPTWTLDQLAGLAFGVVMIAFVVSARQVDVFFAKQQRRQLGLCEQCGGVYDPATCQQAGCPLKKK